MGNFSQHYRAGRLFAVVAVVAGFAYVIDRGGDPGEAVLVAAGMGLVGLVTSLLPDIDHHASKPRDALGLLGGLSVIGGIVALFALAPDLVTRLGIAVNDLGLDGAPANLGAGAVVVAGVAVLAVGGKLFDSMTTHRGFTHSMVFVALLGFGTVGALWQLSSYGEPFAVFAGQNGVLVGLAAALGTLVHLGVDR